MNCKNCSFELNQNDNFCNNCGAKIIKERITIKSLFSHLFVVLGWDSNFFITFRYLLFKPQVVIKEYINGTRKKYTNPFTFLVISLAVSLFVFSQYSDEFIEMSINPNLQQPEIRDFDTPESSKSLEVIGFKNQEEFSKAISSFQMKYYNIVSFVFLPFYTLIAFFVFRKPYNFGEHLIINTYIQTILIFSSVITFVISLLSGYNIFLMSSFILTFLYYCFVYKKIYNYTFKKLLLKILKFFGIMIGTIIVFFIIGTFIAMIFIVKSKI